ncbi:MAG: HNH endonuclease [Candidatus Babeliales bacterium]
MTKVCTKCGIAKEATFNNFKKAKKGKLGLYSKCKECEKEYREKNKEKLKQWFEENSEKVKEQKKQYYKENVEKLKQYKDDWRQQNKDRIKEYGKNYYIENLEIIKEKGKQYNVENCEKLRELHKNYRLRNIEKCKEKEKIYRERDRQKRRDYANCHSAEYRKNHLINYRIYGQNRRTRKKELLDNYSEEMWNATLKYFNNKCAYCGEEKPLQQDHFIALAKSGEYTHNNIVTACKNCNTSKNDADFFEWYKRQPFYNKKREKRILKFLNYNGTIQQLSLII